VPPRALRYRRGFDAARDANKFFRAENAEPRTG
jgi:hypothetical protein